MYDLLLRRQSTKALMVLAGDLEMKGTVTSIWASDISSNSCCTS